MIWVIIMSNYNRICHDLVTIVSKERETGVRSHFGTSPYLIGTGSSCISRGLSYAAAGHERGIGVCLSYAAAGHEARQGAQRVPTSLAKARQASSHPRGESSQTGVPKASLQQIAAAGSSENTNSIGHCQEKTLWSAWMRWLRRQTCIRAGFGKRPKTRSAFPDTF